MGKEVSLGMGVEGEWHLQKGLSGPGVTKAFNNFSITKETFITAKLCNSWQLFNQQETLQLAQSIYEKSIIFIYLS